MNSAKQLLEMLLGKTGPVYVQDEDSKYEQLRKARQKRERKWAKLRMQCLPPSGGDVSHSRENEALPPAGGQKLTPIQ